MATSRFELRKLKEQEDMLPYYKAILAILSTIPPMVLDMIDLPSDVVRDVDDTRLDDDNMGRSAALYSFFLSNAEMTPQDRVVVGQILACAASNIFNENVLTKRGLDKIDALKNTSLFADIGEWFSTVSGTSFVTGDAEREEVSKLDKYIEQYDKTIKDQSLRWTSGGDISDDESATTSSYIKKILDLIPGIDIQ